MGLDIKKTCLLYSLCQPQIPGERGLLFLRSELMPKELDVMEMEYHELISSSNKNNFKNHRFGIRVKTTPKDYAEDFANLVIAVKTELNKIINMEKDKRAEGKKK